MPDQPEMLKAFFEKDPSYDGIFFTAVRSTGIFCRPSCAARPKPENIEFFATIREAVFAGYRPCKKCQPTEVFGTPPAWVDQILKLLEEDPARRFSRADLIALGTTPERARRWFKQHYGMSFAEWCRARRLAEAFTMLKSGASIDDAVFANGYDSHSGFRDAFHKAFGLPPQQSRGKDFIAMHLIESPLGPLVAGATDQGICLLEFSDRRMLETHYKKVQRQMGLPLLPYQHPHLTRLAEELSAYFEGTLRTFSLPLHLKGSPFQEKVWQALQHIPTGTTASYDDLAEQIGQPGAVRAVARANGSNRISILIPCHRVIGKDGQLKGYGGGLWRKRLLLELEKAGKLPGYPFD